jgi:quinol-cytochrome oxidoreductase complex cytochrome b subunit
MNIKLRICRNLLLAAAALLVLVSLVVAVFVIPVVRAYSSPSASPQNAVPAFWAAIGLSLLAAVVLESIGMRARRRTKFSTILLIILAVLVFLLAFALSDAALAYRAEGPAMRTAAILLFLCSAAELAGALLVAATTFLFPREVEADR